MYPSVNKHGWLENTKTLDHFPSWKTPFTLGSFIAIFDYQQVTNTNEEIDFLFSWDMTGMHYG